MHRRRDIHPARQGYCGPWSHTLERRHCPSAVHGPVLRAHCTKLVQYGNVRAWHARGSAAPSEGLSPHPHHGCRVARDWASCGKVRYSPHQPGVMAFALITAAAGADLTQPMKAFATWLCLLLAATLVA